MPKMWVRNAAAEGIGTFALTFAALMTVGAGNLTAYALAQGLTILVLVAALGHVSGGHFNPAVTLAFLLGRRIDAVGAAIYWAAQLIGGIVAALVVLLVMSRDLVASGAAVPATDGDLNLVGAIVLEAIAVFVIVLVIFGTIIDQRAPLSAYPFAIGLAYAAGILAIGSQTGGALNPGRAFGPAVVGGEWGGIASWLLGPLIGAVLAWLVFEYVITMPTDDDALAAEAPAADDALAADASSGDALANDVTQAEAAAAVAPVAAASATPSTAVEGEGGADEDPAVDDEVVDAEDPGDDEAESDEEETSPTPPPPPPPAS